MDNDKDFQETVQEYISLAREHIEGLNIYPRDARRYPFDGVSLELVSKSFALSKACLTLLDAGLPDEAYGLSRSIVECALILRHMTRDRSRQSTEAAKFFSFSLKAMNFWLHHVRRFGDSNILLDADRLAKEWNLDTEKAIEFTRGWDDKFKTRAVLKQEHPLDGLHNPLDVRISQHAADYTHTSQFVHCSQAGIDNYFPDIGSPFRLKKSVGEYGEHRSHCLFIVLIYLHDTIRYVLFGLGFEDSSKLNKLFSDAFNSGVAASGLGLKRGHRLPCTTEQ